jgi:hypothetical protein
MRIRDGKKYDPVSGMENIRIRDKHPGSATLVDCGRGLILFFVLVLSMSKS